MTIQLSDEAEERIKEVIARYPRARSAIMPALYIAQEHFGFINDGAIQWIAARLDIPPVQVMEVATFYTMYYKKPVGRYHFQVCRTLSCALRGSSEISQHIAKRCKIQAGQVSEDGMWSFEEVECLGSCGTAPMCEINDRYFENLTPEKVDEIIDAITYEHPALRYSETERELGSGISKYPKSEVIKE
jgi:NADH-quinone oxidoreductase E subunit